MSHPEQPTSAAHPDSPDAVGTTPLPGHRPSYYEFDPQAAPEVVYGGLEVREKPASTPGDAPQPDTPALDATTRAAGTPAGTPALCPPWTWARRRPYHAAAAVTLALGVIALIVLPIVLHRVARDRENNVPSSSTGSCPSCTETGPAVSVSPAAPTGTQTPIAAQCLDNAAWAQNVSFLGISDSNGRTWPYKLIAAPSAADCCTMCFSGFAAGCQGWAYLPWDSTPVPCTVVYGWNSTDGVSAGCPNGKANVTLTSSTDHAGSMGGAGPCGQDVS